MHGSARAPGSDKDSKIPTENDGVCVQLCQCGHTPAYAHAAGVSLHPSTSVGWVAGPGPGSAPSILPA